MNGDWAAPPDEVRHVAELVAWIEAGGLGATQLLNLARWGISNNDLRELTAASSFATVTGLDLSANALGEAGIQTLASLPTLPYLGTLVLADAGLSDAGVMDLAEWPQLATLTAPTLRRNNISTAGARALAAAPFLASLRYLDLSQNRIGDWGASEIAAAPALARLMSLRLSDNARLSTPVAKAIAGNMRQLRELELNGAYIGERGASVLAAGLSELTTLELRGAAIGDLGARIFANAPILRNVRYLDLTDNSLGAGVAALAASINLGMLLELRLDDNSCGDAGAGALATCPQLTHLAVLHLRARQ